MKSRNSDIFVISDDHSIISQNLKIIGLMGEKFVFPLLWELKLKWILITQRQELSSTILKVTAQNIKSHHS